MTNISPFYALVRVTAINLESTIADCQEKNCCNNTELDLNVQFDSEAQMEEKIAIGEYIPSELKEVLPNNWFINQVEIVWTSAEKPEKIDVVITKK